MRARSVEYGDWGVKSPSSSGNSGMVLSIESGAAGPRTGPMDGAVASSGEICRPVSLFGVSNESSVKAVCAESWRKGTFWRAIRGGGSRWGIGGSYWCFLFLVATSVADEC